jgi:AcrR family transcriptional regulator
MVSPSPAREQFADAVLTIVGRAGYSAVSFRTVASQAGWSLGALQKAFRTKDELLDAALQLAQRRAEQRISIDPPGHPTLRSWLVNLVVETLPLDDERRNACLVDAAFAERAAFNPRFARSIVDWESGLREQLTMLFRGHQAAGVLDHTLDADTLARSILALAAGLATQLLYDPRTEAEIRSLLDESVGSLLRIA